MPYKDADEHRKYQREWIARRRAEYLHDKSCIDCGSTVDLEIDHVDPKQKISHRIWSWSIERREEELKKCVVRCHPHHLEKSIAFDFMQSKHGTRWMYEKYKCKCDPCRAAKQAHVRSH